MGYGNSGKNRGPIHLYLKKSGFKGLTGVPDVGEKGKRDSHRQEWEHLSALFKFTMGGAQGHLETKKQEVNLERRHQFLASRLTRRALILWKGSWELV